jgi:hypothetical protein
VHSSSSPLRIKFRPLYITIMFIYTLAHQSPPPSSSLKDCSFRKNFEICSSRVSSLWSAASLSKKLLGIWHLDNVLTVFFLGEVERPVVKVSPVEEVEDEEEEWRAVEKEAVDARVLVVPCRVVFVEQRLPTLLTLLALAVGRRAASQAGNRGRGGVLK